MSWVLQSVGTEVCELELPHVPTKGRPRFNARTRRTYTPPRTRDDESLIKAAWMEQVGLKRRAHADAMGLRIDVWRPLAKSHPRSDEGLPDTMRPDIDNVIKIVGDALNGVAYVDDSQFVGAACTKHPLFFGDGVRLRIEVSYYETVKGES